MLKDRIESGTNVFELIEFTLKRSLNGDPVSVSHYGVNVAKVREVVRLPHIKKIGSKVAGVEGLFELRGVPIPAINLALALGDESAPIEPSYQVIVTEFSHKRAGFIVHSAKKIRRITWDKVLPPSADRNTCISGMTMIENDDFLFILDLERVLLDLEFGKDHSQILGSSETVGKLLSPKLILLVDDSDIILQTTKHHLEQNGFSVVTAKNGQDAKDLLVEAKNEGDIRVDLIVSDVEMPKLDGLSLTRFIKNDPDLAHLPVLLHSSLSGRANLDAGLAVGADGYVVKSEIHVLLKTIRKTLGL